MNQIILLLLFLCSSTLYTLEPVIILLGPPGSGKGSFSQMVKEKYHYGHISAGDLLRQEIEKQSAIGKEIEAIVAKGDFIDKGIMKTLLSIQLESILKENNSLIIDGYIRDLEDLNHLQQILETYQLAHKSIIIELECQDEVCKDRIKDRLVCMNCSRVYNLKTMKPIDEGVCDYCRGSLKQRINDTQQVIDKRLLNFQKTKCEAYKAAHSVYPYIILDASSSWEKQADLYDQLISHLNEYEGTLDAFLLH